MTRRQPIRLTRRGERLVAVLAVLGFLVILGICGGIETGAIGPGS